MLASPPGDGTTSVGRKIKKYDNNKFSVFSKSLFNSCFSAVPAFFLIILILFPVRKNKFQCFSVDFTRYRAIFFYQHQNPPKVAPGVPEIKIGSRSLQNGRIVLKIGIRAKLTGPDRLVTSRVTLKYSFMIIQVFSPQKSQISELSESMRKP